VAVWFRNRAVAGGRQNVENVEARQCVAEFVLSFVHNVIGIGEAYSAAMV
jgi:hypothetical protein